jgi:hypothetical protein
MKIATAMLTLVCTALAGSAAAERPSFRNVETKLTGFAISNSDDDRFAGSLSGSTIFSERFFVSGALGFGSSNFRTSSAVSLGILRDVGENSIAFASVGALRYTDFETLDFFASSYRRNTINTATATVGIRTMLTERFEGSAGITALERGPYDLQLGLKGTYYFTDSIGGVLELGSSDGDGSGGIGVRFNF